MINNLSQYKRSITSQDGEDGILEYLINNFQINKSLVEIGSHNGVWLSNTFNLWKNYLFNGLLIEYNFEFFKELKNNFEYLKNIKLVNSKVMPTGEFSIDNICNRNDFTNRPGILSIDATMLFCEKPFSYDYHIFKNMINLKPQIILVNHSYNIPPHLEYHEPEDDSFHLLGASVKSLQKLATKKNYKLIFCTSVNSIYVDDSLSKNFPDLDALDLFDYHNKANLSENGFYFISNPHHRCAYYTKNISFIHKTKAKYIRIKHNYFNFGCEKIKAGGYIKSKKKIVNILRPVPKFYKEHMKKFNFYPI